MSNTFLSTGDLGDSLALLPIVRHLGGGAFILCPHEGEGGPREPMTEARANFLLPLIAAQPYITAATFSEHPQGVTHDFSHFRVTHRHLHGESLVGWQARHFRLDPASIDLSPWLTVTPSQETAGRVVMSRSTRYRSQEFPWRRLIQKYYRTALFIGLSDEHADFERRVGKVQHRPVSNALEIAELIAGSQLFVGNQSFPCWIAMALGVNLIQELYPQIPNSKIHRPNAVFASRAFPI